MKSGLYSRMALSNLGKNRRFYLPRILTCAGLLAVYISFGRLPLTAINTIRYGAGATFPPS